MAKVRVGLVGCGFAAELHMYAYQRVYGVDAQVTAVAARGDHVLDFAKKHQIRRTYRDFPSLVADNEIDVVDICTPPALHAGMIVEAAQAGKHVICEKPFTGYFGRGEDKIPIGKHVPKSRMYECVMEEMDKTCAAIKASGRLFMYAEDWVYAPAVTKTEEIIKATKDKILFMKAEESHSGSHAAHAAQWSMTGGGSLIRMGCHPLSTVLYLKQVEAQVRDERIAVSAVTADVGNVAACLPPHERRFINANPVDVEDWGMLTLTFSDGTKSTVFSGDMIMGGVRNVVRNLHERRSAVREHHAEQPYVELSDRRSEIGGRLHHREGRSKNRLAIHLPRRGMDARLLAGDPGFHGMRVQRAAAPRRSRSGLRDDADQLRRLLVGRGGTTDRVVVLATRMPFAQVGCHSCSRAQRGSPDPITGACACGFRTRTTQVGSARRCHGDLPVDAFRQPQCCGVFSSIWTTFWGVNARHAGQRPSTGCPIQNRLHARAMKSGCVRPASRCSAS
jgi:predicted dehydrogenase